MASHYTTELISSLHLFHPRLLLIRHFTLLLQPSSNDVVLSHQSYQWLKEKIVSEDGRKQQAKLKELSHIAEKMGCTLPQLAVGKTSPAYSPSP